MNFLRRAWDIVCIACFIFLAALAVVLDDEDRQWESDA